MANLIPVTVFIKLPTNRQPHRDETREMTQCKCGQPGKAVKMTAGVAQRAFCDDCLWEYRNHYDSPERPITIYRNGR